MKAKLLKKLRREIMRNACIKWYSPNSGALCTTLKGVKYMGSRHTSFGFSFLDSDKIGNELEHIAIEGYLKSKKR